MPEYFFHTQGRLPSGLPPPIDITHFEFKAECENMTIEVATKIEQSLKDKLLMAGRRKIREDVECDERCLGLEVAQAAQWAHHRPEDAASKWNATFGHPGFKFVPETPIKTTEVQKYSPIPTAPTYPGHQRAFSHPYPINPIMNPITPLPTFFAQERRASDPAFPPGGAARAFPIPNDSPTPSVPHRRSIWSRPASMMDTVPEFVQEEAELDRRMTKWPRSSSDYIGDGDKFARLVVSGEDKSDAAGN